MEACESWTPRFFVSIPTINKIVHYDDVRFAPGIYFGIYTYMTGLVYTHLVAGWHIRMRICTRPRFSLPYVYEYQKV